MRQAHEATTQTCPYCGTECCAEWTDVGVGLIQTGPFFCPSCQASEIGPHDDERPLTGQERQTGWYAPGEPPGSSANVIEGQIVSSQEMRDAYRSRFYQSPDYDEPGVVDEWWENIRKPNRGDQ